MVLYIILYIHLFKLLNGLNTLNVLRNDIDGIAGILLNKLVTTTIKSIQFHPSLKYDPGSIIKPIPIIFNSASIVNITINGISDTLNNSLLIDVLGNLVFGSNPLYAGDYLINKNIQMLLN